MKANTSYTITHIKREGNQIEADVLLDDSHALFSGHFPGNPIVPGVLNIEIIQSIIDQTLGKYKIGKINQLKFLKPVVPGETNELHYSITVSEKENGEISIAIRGLSNESVHLKAQLNIQPEK